MVMLYRNGNLQCVDKGSVSTTATTVPPSLKFK